MKNIIQKIKNIVVKIKCVFGKHKWSYQMGGWTEGHYQDVYFGCDACDKNFLMVKWSNLNSEINK